MLGARFVDTQSRNVVAHSILWCPDLNVEMIMGHRARESAVNLVYDRKMVKVCLDNTVDKLAASQSRKPQSKSTQHARNNLYDLPANSSSAPRDFSAFCVSKAKVVKGMFFNSPCTQQYIDLVCVALSVSSISSLRAMVITVHKLIMLLREKINELDNDDMDTPWSIPWNTLDGCTITIRNSLIRVCNFLCLRLLYPRCHDVAVLAKFYQLKPLMMYTPISSWLDFSYNSQQLPLPFQLQQPDNKPNAPISEIHWSYEDLCIIRNICSARYVFSNKTFDEVVCEAAGTFMSRQLLNTHRLLKIGTPAALNHVGAALLDYTDDDFVEGEDVLTLPAEKPPKELLNAESVPDVPSCFRAQGRDTPISMYFASSSKVLLEATEVIEATFSKANAIAEPQQFKSSYIYTTHEDHKVDNMRAHALNTFIQRRSRSHVSLRSNAWQRKACLYCCREIFACQPKLICDQCCLPAHQKCVPVLRKARREKVIHHGDVKYTYMCTTCTSRNVWIRTAIRPEMCHSMQRSEMLVLHPRTLMDTCLVGIFSLMAESPDSHSLVFPITQVWAFIKAHWGEVKPVAAFRNVNVENDEEEEEEEEDGMQVDDGSDISDADLAEIKHLRAPFKALLVSHPAFEVDIAVNNVSLSPCFLISLTI